MLSLSKRSNHKSQYQEASEQLGNNWNKVLIKFYGVRGSIASPGRDTVEYGGNTACVYIEADDGSLIVFDAGTGIKILGEELLNRQSTKDLNLLFSHYHWDHIQGFPFFLPAYQKDQVINLLAAHLDDNSVHSVLTQMTDPHFPVLGDKLAAEVNILSTENNCIYIGENRIETKSINHPGGGSAYLLRTLNGSSMAYVTDNELDPPEKQATTYQEWVEFLQGVDFLIHDAMYLDKELERIHGWGHSLISQTLQLAADANVANLVLFHHDPSRTDQQLDEIKKDSENWMSEHFPSCKVFLAKEADEYTVTQRQVSKRVAL